MTEGGRKKGRERRAMGGGRECDRGREGERKRKESYGWEEENVTEGGREKGRERRAMGIRKII